MIQISPRSFNNYMTYVFIKTIFWDPRTFLLAVATSPFLPYLGSLNQGHVSDIMKENTR